MLVNVGLIAGVVSAGILLLMFVINIICCLVWCNKNKTARVDSNNELHFVSNPANTPKFLEEYANSHVSAYENCLDISGQDYEVIASDNVAYQAANRSSRDNLHLVSNEAYASSTNPRSNDQEYAYVDKNYVTAVSSRGEENKVTSSDGIIEQAATRHSGSSDKLHLELNVAYASNANPTLDGEDQEYAYVNEDCLASYDMENEVTTFDNVAYEGVNRHSSDDTRLDSNAAYSSIQN